MYIALENELTKPDSLQQYILENPLNVHDYALLLWVYYIIYDCINVYINDSLYISYYRDSFASLFGEISKVIFNK